MTKVAYFPVPASMWVKLVSSFCRRTIPGTSRLYARAKNGCVKKHKCKAAPGHCATDIAAEMHSIVRACADGEARTGWDPDGYGNWVEIHTKDGVGFLTAHHHKLTVKDGQRVKAGDQIATVGMTGQTKGPHVHFEKRAKAGDWCTAVDAYAELVAAQKKMREDA